MKKSHLIGLLMTSFISSSLLFPSSETHAAPIAELILTGGSFSMAGYDNPLIPAAFASMSVDGSYDGSEPTGTEVPYTSTSIATFDFGFFGPAGVYTAETDGFNGPFPGVTGDLTGSDLTLDLSSWTWWWKQPTNLGSANVTATVNENGDFEAAWDAVVVGGAFNGAASSWIITGHVSAVPIPSSLWLFGSGLVWAAGLHRKRNQKAGNVRRRKSK